MSNWSWTRKIKRELITKEVRRLATHVSGCLFSYYYEREKYKSECSMAVYDSFFFELFIQIEIETDNLYWVHSVMYVISVVYLLECNWSRVLLMPVYCDLRHNDISPLFFDKAREKERKKLGKGESVVLCHQISNTFRLLIMRFCI